MLECIGGFRVCPVVFRTGRADSGMLGDLALRFYCSIGCIQGRLSSEAEKLGEPVTQQTHTKSQKGHTFQVSACKTCQYNQCPISLSV